MVVELTRQGELRADDGTLVEALQAALESPEHPVFVPARTYIRDGQRITVHLMEGYAFIASGLPDPCYFDLERSSQYVRRVLSNRGSNGMPVLHVISETDVQEMRRQLRSAVSQDLSEGMWVKITQGSYAGLVGEVVGFEDEEAFVHIKLRSFEIIRTVPRVFLEPSGDGDVI